MTSSAGRSLGRYRLERLVGRGGMAEVWEARDQTLGRRVAVKIILPTLAGETRFHERFRSEARAVAALEHENVLPIYDYGDEGGEPYLVMPFLENGTLAERLKRGEVAPAHAMEWIRQLASALDAAHAAGVLHRDVKPANVMLGGGGRLLLADFGIAKSNQGGDLTATGIALGTPAYMAPELARGEAATSASDRYALGVVAYELLCGRPPFVGDNALALLHQHLTTPVPQVVAVRPDLPEDLDPAFARILAKDPAERPTSCAALAEEIVRALSASGAPGGPRHAGARYATPVGAEDATLATPALSHGPLTPATRAMGSAPGQSSGAAGTAPPLAVRAGAPSSGTIPTVALPSRAGAGPSSTTSSAPPKRRVATVAIAAAIGAVLVIAACWLWVEGRQPASRADDATPARVAAGPDRGDATAEPEATRPAVAPPPGAPPPPLASPVKAPPSSSAVAATEPTGRDGAVPKPPPGPSAPAPAVAEARVASGSGAAPGPGPAGESQVSGLGADVPAVGAADAAAPASSGAHPGGRYTLPPSEAFAIFTLIADAWRQGRFRPQLFDEVEHRSTPLRATKAPGAELLERWIAGGRALVSGDREQARSVVAQFQTLDEPPEWVTLLPGRFLAPHPGSPPDWQVALFWADPRNEARSLVDAAAKATPNDRNLQLARAVVEHLDGHHAEAARQAVALEPQVRQGRPRWVVARFAGDQLLWSGDVATAISWYKTLLVAHDRNEIAAVLRTLSQEGGPQLVGRACSEGFTPACDAARGAAGARRRTRAQP